MRDDIEQGLSDRVAAQHNPKTIWNTATTARVHIPIISCPGSEVSPSRLHVSQVSTRTFIPTKRNWFTSVLDPTLEHGFQSLTYL